MALFRQLIRQSHHQHLIAQVGKQIKGARALLRGLLRGLAKVNGEWRFWSTLAMALEAALRAKGPDTFSWLKTMPQSEITA